MNPFLALVRKDLKLFLGDRRAVILTLTVPIAIASFFGFIMGGQSGQPKSNGVGIHVVDLDQSPVSREIVRDLQDDANLKVTLSDENQARQQVRNGKTALAVILPKNFGADAGRALFGGGKKPQIGLPHDPSRNMEVNLVKGLLMQHVMQTVASEMFNGAGGRTMLRESLDRFRGSDGPAGLAPELRDSLRDMLAGVDRWMEKSAAATNPATGAPQTGGMSMPFAVQDDVVAPSGTTPQFNGFAHSFGGMGVQFVLMAAIELGIGLLLERERGLWKRLRSAPLSRFTLLASRMISGAIISFFTLLGVFAFSMAVFHVRINGSVPGFILCCASIALFAASLGLFVGSIGRTPQATRGIAILVVLIMVMLGGAWMPSFIFPPWLQTVTLAMPTRWAVDGLAAMTWRGLDFSAVLAPVGVLLGAAVLLGAIAVARFRWEAE